MNIIGPTNDGLSFAQAAGTKNARTKDPTTIQCYSCKEMGQNPLSVATPRHQQQMQQQLNKTLWIMST